MTAAPDIVIARIEPDVRGASLLSVGLLVWPMEPASYSIGPCVCWSYLGQHGPCEWGYVLRQTKSATDEQAQELLQQWRSEGPDRDGPIRLLRRAPRWSAVMAAHRQALRGSTE